MDVYRPVCWGMIALGALGWAMLVAFGPAAAPHWMAPLGALPAVLAPIPGVILGAAAVALGRTGPQRPGSFSLGSGPAAALVAAAFSVIALAIAGAEIGNAELRPLNAALVCVFGPLTLLTGVFAVEAIRRGDGVALESHWGGLGGGLGGWRLSTGGVLIILTLICAGATFAGAVLNPALLVGTGKGGGKPAAAATNALAAGQ